MRNVNRVHSKQADVGKWSCEPHAFLGYKQVSNHKEDL